MARKSHKLQKNFLSQRFTIFGVLFVVILGIFFIFSSKQIVPQSNELLSNDKELPISVVNAPQNKIIFLKSDNLYVVDTNKNVEQLTNFSSRSIASSYFDPTKELVGYVSGSPYSENNDIIPSEIHLISLKTKEDKKIYSYDPKVVDGVITDSIRGFSFAKSSQQIAFFTDDKIFINDLNAEHVKEVVSRQRTVKENDPYDLYNGVFSDVTFSPDSRYLLIRGSGHESGKYKLFNIETKEEREVFSSSDLHNSTSIVGWSDNETAIISEYHDEEYTKKSEQNTTTFYFYKVLTNSKSKIFQVHGLVFNPVSFQNMIVFWNKDQIFSYNTQTRKLLQITSLSEKEIVNGMTGPIEVDPQHGTFSYTKSIFEVAPGAGVDRYRKYSLYSFIPTKENSSNIIIEEVHTIF